MVLTSAFRREEIALERREVAQTRQQVPTNLSRCAMRA